MTDQEEGRSLAQTRPAEDGSYGVEPHRDFPADAKRLANLRARAALQGVELHVTTDDRGMPLYCGVKWAMCKHMHSLDDVAEWVQRIDGRSE